MPPEVKRAAFADLEGSVGEERVRAAAEIWRYRDYTKNRSCRLEGLPMAPIAPEVRKVTTFMGADRAFREIGRRYHIAHGRLHELARWTGITYTVHGRVGVAGKMFGIFFYTRYRRHSARGSPKDLNEVFTLRLYTPAPLTFTCDNSIASADIDQPKLRSLVRTLLLSIMLRPSGKLYIRPLEVSPACPDPRFQISGGGLEWGVPPFSEVYTDIIDKYLSLIYGTNAEKEIEAIDRQKLTEEIPLGYPTEVAETIVNEFVENLSVTEIRVGCTENPFELYPMLENIERPTQDCLEKGAISGRCDTVEECLRDMYCPFIGYHSYIRSGTELTLDVSKGMAWSRGTVATANIYAPVWLWANGYIKVPLTMPTIAVIERARFSDANMAATLMEYAQITKGLPFEEAVVHPTAFARALVRSFIEPFAPD
ncbi:MAG: hypothetical protein L7H04_07020, partial [Vulcanisaeta sp.]|nr:hypothetical protein [Vulcanisaeta sp.]